LKKLILAVLVIVILIILVVVGCTNKGLVGPAPGTGVEVSSSCVTCHTDKTILKELAVTEEEAVSEETTGEG
jgi:hypothetical protein